MLQLIHKAGIDPLCRHSDDMKQLRERLEGTRCIGDMLVMPVEVRAVNQEDSVGNDAFSIEYVIIGPSL